MLTTQQDALMWGQAFLSAQSTLFQINTAPLTTAAFSMNYGNQQPGIEQEKHQGLMAVPACWTGPR